MSILLVVKKCLLWAAGVSAIVVPSSLLTLYHNDPSRFNVSVFSDESSAKGGSAKPRHDVPFDLLDATQECQSESKERLGESLLRASVDWHSSRFQKNRGVYVVVLQANVGELRQFNEVNVYCYINPRTEKVSYFNAYDDTGKSYVSRAISFDSVIKAFSSDN